MNIINPFVTTEETSRRRHVIKSFKAKADAKRSPAEKFADLLTTRFGTVTFLALNMTWFVVWILWNTGNLPGLTAFDPFPFGLLTMVVSLEAIFLAIIVLISQNREARVNELREEVDLQINMIAEEEITRLLKLVLLLCEKEGIKLDDDPAMRRLMRMSNDKIERDLEKELG